MGQPSDILRDFVSPGDLLAGRFRIRREIGAGAYGAIYLAEDLEQGRELAVKALPPRGQGTSDTALGRFERELKVVRNLAHPSIVEVADYGETEAGVQYMIMEYVDGETLEQQVGARGGFGTEVALSVTRQIASALHSAHQSGVIHRDLKPANIMLTSDAPDYEVKVLDFGMAKLSTRLGDESIVALTREGMAVGTPRYIAPEQARGSPDIGPWTDVYALGLLMYEMLTGRKAVQHDSVESAVTEHVDPEPLALPELEGLSQGVERLVREMVRKEMDARVRSAAEVVARIDTIVETPFRPPDHSTRERSAEQAQVSAGSNDGSRSRSGARAIQVQDPEAADAREDRAGAIERRRPEAGDRGDSEQYGAAASTLHREGMWERRIRHASFVGGAIVATGFVGLLAFMVISAQAHGLGRVARAALGGAPIVMAALSLFDEIEGDPGWRFLRNSVIYSGLGFLAAHLVGPMRLARQLWRDPVWFLDPLAGVPGIGLVSTFLTWLGESYALLLVSAFGSGSGLGL